MEPRLGFPVEGKAVCSCLRTYQRQHEIEEGRPAVEEDGQEHGDRGEEQAHVSAHHDPQRL